MKSVLSLSILIISLFLATLSPAQNPIREVQNLDSIIIQNQRIQIPFSKQNREIIILDRAIIQALPVQSVNELLSYVSGIDVRQRGVMGAQADIGMNGGTFDQTLVLLNGMKIIDPQTGHNMMNLPIGLDAIERVEVLKGPAASAYGVNALNGAINIITRQPDKTGLVVDISSGSSFKKDSGSQNLYYGTAVEINSGLVAKNTQHFLAFNTLHSNGYRHNTAIRSNKFFYSNKMKIKDSRIQMMGGFIDNDFGANGFYAAPKDKESKEHVQTALAAIRGRIKLNNIWSFKPGVSYRYSFDDYLLQKDHPEVYENKHRTHVLDATLNNSLYTGKGTIGLGVEMRNAHIRSNSLGNHNRTNLGLFTNYSMDFIPGMLINLGLYANYSNDFGWEWMPSMDAGYNIFSNFRVFVHAGTGMRLPTYTDLYYKGPVNIGNAELQPENARQIAGGIKYSHHRLNATVSYFHRHTGHFIDWVKDQLSDPWETENYQNIKTRGISFSADYRIIPISETTGYGLLAGTSYTWLDPRLLKENTTGRISKYALENLRQQWITRLKFHLPDYFDLTLSGKYQQRVSYKDYFLLAARLSTTLRAFQIYADGSNLTNIQYIEAGAIPMPGSWFTLGIKWTPAIDSGGSFRNRRR